MSRFTSHHTEQPENIKSRAIASLGFARDKLFRNEHGSTFVYIVALTSVLILMGGVITSTTIFGSRDAYQHLHRTQAFYLAEAGVTHALHEFKNNVAELNAVLKGTDDTAGTEDDGVLSFGAFVSMGNGYCSVVVADNDDGDADMYTDADNIVLVASTGTDASGVTQTVKAYLEVVFPSAAGMTPRAVVMAAGPVKTLGALVVDGRDHNLSEAFIPHSGVLGVSTEQTFQQSGASKVGGTAGGADYCPSKPGNPAVIETSANWSAQGGFPNTPDKVVGLPEGTLLAIAQSGVNGSQYVTDAASLSFPLSGVTYVEIPSGGEWVAVHFSDSTGILVVHNASTDAVIKNLNTGSFQGLLIADDIVHIHCTILGAVVNLSAAPSSGNCIGNGSGDVLYSSEAIAAALAQIGAAPAVSVKSWFY